MATPSGPERRLLAAGFKKASAWGTAVALGAGNEIRAKAISGLVHSRDYSPGLYANQPFVNVGTLTDIKAPEPAISGDLQYENGALAIILALLFGTAGAPTGPTGTTAYKHIFQWADLVGGFGTLAAEFPGIIYECASFKPFEFGLKVGDGRIQFEAKGRGDQVVDSSTVNTATQMDALSWSGADTPALFSHASFKMNAQSGADVAAATALNVSGFDLSFKRALDNVHVAGSAAITEPKENGFPDVRLKLDFPRYATDNSGLQALMIAGTLQKVLVTLTSPLFAGSAVPYSIKIFLPAVRIVTQAAPWDELVKNGIELAAEEPSANPTGMDHKRPYIEIVDKLATDYLA